MKPDVHISLRIPAELLKLIDKQAEAEGRNRSNMIVRLCQQAIGKGEKS